MGVLFARYTGAKAPPKIVAVPEEYDALPRSMTLSLCDSLRLIIPLQLTDTEDRGA